MYAILDIETTGGQYNQEGITEIAIYRFDGQNVIDQFISLVNPEREIQNFVVKLTGINQKMLRTAPKFYEIAKRIVEITEDCILVAHNADFDYRILRTEFRRLGFNYQRSSICTVELAKQFFPDAKSYSLGKLVRSLGIPVSDRHRANGDALATLELFKLLLAKDSSKQIITQWVKQDVNSAIPARLLNILDELPTQMGVYYIYNQEGKLLYIGRNKNIKKRVNQHFTSPQKKDLYLQKHTHKVVFELTGNELIAQLKELQEIQLNKPALNGKRLFRPLSYGLFAKKNEKGYLTLDILPLQHNTNHWLSFETLAEGKNTLFELTEQHTLCTKLTGFSSAAHNCYNYTINKCKGACIEEENPQEYNARTEEALQQYSFKGKTIAILDKGRTSGEKSVILIENGIFLGYGFANLNFQASRLSILKNLITPMNDSEKIHRLIQQYLRKHRKLTIISL